MTKYSRNLKSIAILSGLLLMLSGLLLLGCAKKEAAKAEGGEHVVTVDVAPVLSSPISQKITSEALLYPLQQAAIVPKISAPVKKFYVDRGAHVSAGQLLAELENSDLAGSVAENKASVDQAEASYQTVAKATVPEEAQKAEVDVRTTKDVMDQAQKLYDNRQSLYKEGAISQKDVNDAQVALAQARSQYEIAKSHLESLKSVAQEQSIKGAAAQREAAKARLQSAEAQLGYSRVISPISGVVTDRPIYNGEMASNTAPMITIMDTSQIVARSHVSQEEAAQLKVGNTASLVVPDGGAPLPGKVTVISPALDPSNTTVEVWVQAANTGNRLKPGTSIRVDVVTQSLKDALIIPEAAVLTSPSGNKSVMVIDSDNKPHKKPVTLGIHDNGNIQVKEGLESGERVVTVGAYELAKLEEEVFAKTKVQIAPPKEDEDEDE
jgi:multidrug efflux pump subunit AcrA (membrane-fusion protein)